MKFRIRFGRKVQDEDRRIIFALCCLMFIPSINNFLNSVLQIGLSIYLEFLTPVSYIFMGFMSVFVLYKYVITQKVYLFFILLTVAAVSVSYLLYPQIRSDIYASAVDLVYSPVNKLIFFCIPALAGMASLSDHDALLEQMRPWGKLTAALGSVTLAFLYSYVGKMPNYMVYSYFMLLPICVCYEHAKLKRAMSDLVIAILGTVCIIACGARGAVVSLALYFFVQQVTSLGKRVNGGVLIKFLCISMVLLVVVFFYREILLLCIALFDQMGISSRFVSSLYSGELMQDSARLLLLKSVVRGLGNNPVGYGLFGDRYVIGSFGYPQYTYSHNFFLEMLCDFGIFGGSIVIMAILWKMIKTIGVLKNRRTFSLLLVLLPYGFFQLLFSSSFLENTIFFMIMAMLFCVNWKRKLNEGTGDRS